MADAKLLCIFTTVLGHNTEADRFIEALGRLQGIHPAYVLVGSEDYIKYPAPWWVRATDPWHGEFVARHAARQAVEQPFDLLLVNAWELVVAFRHLARRVPAAAYMDSVPATITAQFRERGMNDWKRWLSHQVHHRSFARAAREFDLFLPKSSDCAESLYRDYGIERERCHVTLAPLPLDSWKPAGRTYSGPLRLLFVGNDFVRKGGDFLLRMYSEHLAGSCILTIASNAQAMAARELPAGVEWLHGKNREQLLEVYRACDVFVFPTQQDYAPFVVAEALAVGLPCLVSDVSGVRDLISDGESGFVMPRGSPAGLWAERILGLATNPTELLRMSACARRTAEEKLDFNRFVDLLRDVVDRLRSQQTRIPS